MCYWIETSMVQILLFFSIFETVKSNGRRRKCQPDIWPGYWPETVHHLLSGHLLKDEQWNWENFTF